MKISAVQFPVDSALGFDRFLEKNLNYFQQAVQNKSQLCLFPELASLDLIDFKKQLASQWQSLQEQDLFQKYIQIFKNLSTENNISVLGSSFPVIENNQIYNVAPMIFPDGKVILQKKIFLTPGEVEWNWSHGHQLHKFDFMGLKTCILICHDSEFPQISESLSRENVDLLLVPSMTENHSGLERVRFCSQARAIEHHCYAVVTGTTGVQKKDYTGQACLLTPRNLHFADLPEQIGRYNEAQVVHFNLDLDLLKKSKALSDTIFPCRDQRERRLTL